MKQRQPVAHASCGRHDIRSSIGNQPPIGNQLLRRAGIAREHIAEPNTSSRRSPLDHGGRSHLDTVFLAVRSTRSFGTAAVSARCSCRSRTSARDCVGSSGRSAPRIRCAYRTCHLDTHDTLECLRECRRNRRKEQPLAPPDSGTEAPQEDVPARMRCSSVSAETRHDGAARAQWS